MTMVELEKRLSLLEKEVKELRSERKGTVEKKLHPVEVLERIHGTFANDPMFDEAMRLGRAWRKSLDVKPKKKSKRR